jgi:hypothetical protein
MVSEEKLMRLEMISGHGAIQVTTDLDSRARYTVKNGQH